MKMARLNIQLPPGTKIKIDAMRDHGYTAAGYIRRLIEEDLRIREASENVTTQTQKKGR